MYCSYLLYNKADLEDNFEESGRNVESLSSKISARDRELAQQLDQIISLLSDAISLQYKDKRPSKEVEVSKQDDEEEPPVL